jgi:hypothetical protein
VQRIRQPRPIVMNEPLEERVDKAAKRILAKKAKKQKLKKEKQQ